MCTCLDFYNECFIFENLKRALKSSIAFYAYLAPTPTLPKQSQLLLTPLLVFLLYVFYGVFFALQVTSSYLLIDKSRMLDKVSFRNPWNLRY
jgi:hypothetical protein